MFPADLYTIIWMTVPALSMWSCCVDLPLHLLGLQEKQYGTALALAAEIVEHGVREHPELGIGSTAKGQANVRRIANSPVLQVSIHCLQS